MKRALGGLLMLLTACDLGGAPAEEQLQARGSALSLDTSPDLVFTVLGSRFLSLDLIGRGLNGTSFNGKALDGHALARVRYDGVLLGQGKARRVHLKGSAFQGAPSVVGAIFTGELDDGEALPLRVEGAVQGVSTSDLDVFRYAVTYQAEQGWQPLCGLDAGGQPVLAIPLAGRWDLRQGVSGGGDWLNDPEGFTFACEGFVLAKCVDMGYAPWRVGRACPAGAKGGSGCATKVSLAPYHRACTRMLRADYCGDGTSYTQDGTPVNAYDRIGVRYDSEEWGFEAEWDESGALCAERLRDPALAAPPCLGRLSQPACGTRESLALLLSELAP